MQPLEDITSIQIHLNELRSKFDEGMRHGKTFSDLKKIYLQIKERECQLKAMDWNPLDTRTKDTKRYRHIDEQPPLL